MVEVAPRCYSSAIGLWGDFPCAMGPRPATDRLEAKQLRVCLLSKRVEVLRQKSKSQQLSLLDLAHSSSQRCKRTRTQSALRELAQSFLPAPFLGLPLGVSTGAGALPLI